jgi:hypothetical protein
MVMTYSYTLKLLAIMTHKMVIIFLNPCDDVIQSGKEQYNSGIFIEQQDAETEDYDHWPQDEYDDMVNEIEDKY